MNNGNVKPYKFNNDPHIQMNSPLISHTSNYDPAQPYPSLNMVNTQHNINQPIIEPDLPSNFSYNPPLSSKLTNTAVPNDAYSLISNKIIQIDMRIANFNQFPSIIWTMIILTSLCLIHSIADISRYDPKSRYHQKYEIFNFFVNLGHLLGYIYGLQAFTKQLSLMMKNFLYVSSGMVAINVIYVLMYFGLAASFGSWVMNISYLIVNLILRSQVDELFKLIREKEEWKLKYDAMIL